MGILIRNEIMAALDEAERNGAWLIEHDRSRAQTLRRHVQSRDLVEPLPGCFAHKITWENMKKLERYQYTLRAMANAYPSCVFCRESAAVIHGLWVSNNFLNRIHLATTRRAHTTSSRTFERHIVETDDFTQVDGMNVTSLKRTAFDCLRAEPFDDALPIADSALRLGNLSKDELMAYFFSMRHFPSIASARRTLSYANPRSESGGESLTRAVIIDLGFAIPELQVEFHDKISGKTYRPDFLWTHPDGSTIAGELDGKIKYEDPRYMGNRSINQILEDERLRESRMTLYINRICRFSLRDVLNRPYFEKLLTSFDVPRLAQ